MVNNSSWKPIPLALKAIFVLTILWIIGSIMGISMRATDGLPFFGTFVYGIGAITIVLILDIIAPLLFLCGTWKRKHWTPCVAYIYMGIFILNSIVALFTVRDQLGTMPIIIPAAVTLVFLLFVVKHKKYYK